MTLQREEDLEKKCVEFLYREAELLDSGKLSEWLELLTNDITYSIPVRVAREGTAGPGFSETTFLMREDKLSLITRVKRLQHEYSWSEEIPSRTRRFITNIRFQRASEATEILVKNNLLLFRGQGENPVGSMISGERHDTLRIINGSEIKLARRLILLDHTTLPTSNLSIFL